MGKNINMKLGVLGLVMVLSYDTKRTNQYTHTQVNWTRSKFRLFSFEGYYQENKNTIHIMGKYLQIIYV